MSTQKKGPKRWDDKAHEKSIVALSAIYGQSQFDEVAAALGDGRTARSIATHVGKLRTKLKASGELSDAASKVKRVTKVGLLHSTAVSKGMKLSSADDEHSSEGDKDCGKHSLKGRSRGSHGVKMDGDVASLSCTASIKKQPPADMHEDVNMSEISDTGDVPATPTVIVYETAEVFYNHSPLSRSPSPVRTPGVWTTEEKEELEMWLIEREKREQDEAEGKIRRKVRFDCLEDAAPASETVLEGDNKRRQGGTAMEGLEGGLLGKPRDAANGVGGTTTAEEEEALRAAAISALIAKFSK